MIWVYTAPKALMLLFKLKSYSLPFYSISFYNYCEPFSITLLILISLFNITALFSSKSKVFEEDIFTSLGIIIAEWNGNSQKEK